MGYFAVYTKHQCALFEFGKVVSDNWDMYSKISHVILDEHNID